MSQDLAIYIKTLLEKTSKDNISTEVTKLVEILQQKLDKLNINIKFDSKLFDGLKSQINNTESQIKNINNLLNKTIKLTGKDISKQSLVNVNGTDVKLITDMNVGLGRTLKIVQELKKDGNTITTNTINSKEIDKAIDKVNQFKVKTEQAINILRNKFGDGIFNSQKLTGTDAIIKQINKITQDTRGWVEGTKNWENELTKVENKLKSLDQQMNKNKLLIDQRNKANLFDTGYNNRIQDIKVRAIVDTRDINKLEQDFVKLNDKIKNALSKNDTKAFDRYSKEIVNLKTQYTDMIKLERQLSTQFDQNNAEFLRGMKLREAEQKKFITNQERIAKQLNTKTNNALDLGVKFNNLSPEQLAPLEKALQRYQNLIKEFQQKNISGQVVSDKDLERLSRLENAIKRVYDLTRIASKDSRGFNFEQYPKMTNAVHGATNAQNYYNQSIIAGKKLLEASTQETEKYIKVTQRLREGSQISNITAYINKATGETHKFSESLKDLMTRTYDLGSAFKTALQKISLWAGATGIFYNVTHGLKQMGTEIINIDTKLTELSKVLDNNTNWSKLMQDTAESANKMARSLTEALDAEIEFSKQGFNASQSVELARSSMLGANVTGLKTGEMANYLTGILAQFNIEAEKSSTIIDKLNEVDNNFAITSIGLAQAINKAGESAQQFGVTIDELIGFTTSIGTATRESGNQIGNMLKFVFARINMDKTQETLASMGIAVKDITGELLPLGQIYGEVANKWDSMTRAEKTYLAESLAGKHHITRLMALFDNWKISLDATATSQTSLGSAIEENYKHLNSLESKINLNKAAFQEFSYALGESGVKTAMIAVLGTIAQFINGFTELTQNYNGLTTATSILGGALILLIPKIKLEYTNWIIRNNLVATAIPLNQRLTISYTALSTVIKGATVSLIAFSKAMLLNPLTWIVTALTAIPMILGHFKQVREEQEQLNRTYEETKQKLDDIIERTNKIGQPTLQDINDIDATVKKLDELKNKLQEIDQKNKSGAFGFQSTSVKTLSKELKDLATQMGINITQYYTVDEVLEAIKLKQDELSGSMGNAKDNSTEYQKTLIDQATNQTKVADNNVKLIDTYQELSNKSNLTAEEQKKLNDITAILTQTYPHLIKVKDDTVDMSNDVISAIKKEAKEQKILADENEKTAKRQMIANRGRLQEQRNASLKIIQSLQGEIAALHAVHSAKIDPDFLFKNQAQNTLDRMQGKDTPYSSGIDLLLGEINAPNSTKLYALNNKYEEEQRKLKETYDNIANIDDALSSSISDLTQSTDDAEDSSNSITDAKSAEALAWEEVTNEIKKYNNEITRLESISDNAVKGSKERRDAIHAENEERRKAIAYLKGQSVEYGKTITSFITSNGKLPNPIPGTQLKDSFGAPRDGGSRRHEGIDIAASDGTEIHSTTPGKVKNIGYSNKGGWGVTISDPQGNTHYYAHMNTDPSKILGIGQEILAGQVIGYVGSTGNAQGPHLHYGIKDANNKAINPYDLLTNDVSTTPVTVNINGVSSDVKFADIINKAIANNVDAQKLGITPALIAGMIDVESDFNPDIINTDTGAMGLMQFLPDTWKEQGGGNAFDPELNIQRGIAYLVDRVQKSGGDLTQGLEKYGGSTTGKYAKDVYENTQKYGMSPTSVNLSKKELSYAKLTEDRIKHQEEINAEILKLEKEIVNASREWYEDLWNESENIQKEFDDKISFSKSKQETMLTDSQEYRNEIDLQSGYLKGKQKQKEAEAEQMRQAIDNLNQAVAEGTFKDLDYIAKLQENVKQLGIDWWSLQKEINDTSFEKITSKLDEFNNIISDINNNTQNLESELSMLGENTSEYNNKLKQIIDTHKQELLAIQNKKAYLESELMLVEKGTIAYDELKQKLQEVTSAELDARKALYDKNKQIIDDTISLIKSAYEKEKDIALEAIDEQMEAEDKRHDKVKENLDDELDQYEDSINQKLKLLDELSSTEDYEDNIKKLNDEKLEIQKQIDLLAMDDSYEAKAKKEELLKELSEIDLEISKTQKDREKELLKDSLNDQLDAYEKDIKEKQDAEDDKYDAEKERLDKIKDETEKYYQDMIDNEINFSNISQELMKGNIDNTIAELQRLLTFVKNNISNLGQGVGNTLASEINNSINQLTGNLGSSNTNSTGSGNNSNNNSSNNSSNSGNTPSPIATFSPGSYENTDGTAIMKSVTLANALGESVSWDGEGTPVIIGGKSFAYRKIEGNDSLVGIREVAEALGHEVKWNNGIIDIYHEGGQIGNAPTNKIMDIVNKLFNVSPNESVVKMLKGELAIPQNNVMKNFIPNMHNFVSSFIPNINPQSQVAGVGNTNIIMNVNIDKLTGDKNGAKEFFSVIRTELKKIGK